MDTQQSTSLAVLKRPHSKYLRRPTSSTDDIRRAAIRITLIAIDETTEKLVKCSGLSRRLGKNDSDDVNNRLAALAHDLVLAIDEFTGVTVEFAIPNQPPARLAHTMVGWAGHRAMDAAEYMLDRRDLIRAIRSCSTISESDSAKIHTILNELSTLDTAMNNMLLHAHWNFGVRI